MINAFVKVLGFALLGLFLVLGYCVHRGTQIVETQGVAAIDRLGERAEALIERERKESMAHARQWDNGTATRGDDVSFRRGEPQRSAEPMVDLSEYNR